MNEAKQGLGIVVFGVIPTALLMACLLALMTNASPAAEACRDLGGTYSKGPYTSGVCTLSTGELVNPLKWKG